MGRIPPLALSRWTRLEPVAKPVNEGEEQEVDDNPLSDEERASLVKDWGMPSSGRRYWKSLMNAQTDKPSSGQLSYEMSYLPIPPVEVNKVVVEGEEEEQIETGIVTVTIHQVKELSGATKISNLFVIAELNNNVEIARTFVKKKNQTPVWEKAFDFFTTDLEGARVSFKIRDEKDLNTVPMGHATLSIKDVLSKKVLTYLV